VPIRNVQEVMAALERSINADTGPGLRRRFQERFTLTRHVASVVEALETLETR